MRILIPGATGMLGSRVVAAAEARGHEVVPFERGRWNVTQLEQCEYWVSATAPDVVINCTGIVPQRLASVPEVEMVEVNGLAPFFLGEACRHHDARLIQISTDCVFDGTARYNLPWLPQDTPNATDVYGRSKAMAELAVPEVTTVVRTSFIGPQHGLWRWYAEQTTPVEGWYGAQWSGHTVGMVADNIVAIAETNPYPGVVHMATERPITKGYVLHMLQNVLGGVDIEDVTQPSLNRWLLPTWTLPDLTEADIERLARGGIAHA